ncbi:MAG: MFS transporter [Bdellovibrionales bacterium]
MYQLLLNRLSPFKHQNFRRFFFVQTLSLTGSWAADLARAWIILSMMESATALGGLLLATALPGLFLILHGGVLVDRIDVRRLMMGTKFLLGLIALGLAAMVQFGHVQYWHLLVFALMEGVVNAFDSPAYQALTVRLVPRQDFQQALALNSTNFHFSRMMGPAMAGLLMTMHGPSTVFLFDGLTYLGLTLVLGTINLEHAKRRSSEIASGQWNALVAGIRHMTHTPRLRYKVLQLLATIILMFPLLTVVFRTFLKAKFNLDAQTFGLVFTLPSLGSMTGALSFAVIQPKVPIRALLVGIPGAAATTFLVPHMPTPMSAAWVMALAGFFMYLTFASITVSLQLEVEERFRGRVGSVIGLCFVSLGPLMGLPIGSLADTLGFEPSIHLLTSIFVVVSAIIAYLHRHSMRHPVLSHGESHRNKL